MGDCGTVSGGTVSARGARDATQNARPGGIGRRRAALLLACLPSLAVAQDAASYVQQGVPAEASAENGVLARERALANGRRIAWDRLAAQVGGTPGLPDQQIEAMVASMVIEEERTAPTRYVGRITVRFDPARVRAVLSGRAPGTVGAAGIAASGPASNWQEAIATYGSMREWLELRRRLQAAAPVASVEIVAIATDAARLRLGLRAPAALAAPELAAAGVALAPAMGPEGETWRLGLGSGG